MIKCLIISIYTVCCCAYFSEYVELYVVPETPLKVIHNIIRIFFVMDMNVLDVIMGEDFLVYFWKFSFPSLFFILY